MASYTIKSGDTLSKIASAYGTDVSSLASSNKIANPDKIQAGAIINVPDASTGTAPTYSSASQLPGAVTTPTYTPTTTPAARTAAFATTPTPPPVPKTGALTTSSLAQGNSAPDVSTYLSYVPKNSLSGMVSTVANTTLDSTGKAIDALLAKQQSLTEQQKTSEQTQVDALGRQISDRSNSTAAQDALAAAREKFNVDQTISDLQSVQTKIASAQEALNMGLIYEGDQPVRMSLLSGRQATLQKQGLAVIGALQSTAQILQGNIDLAKSYSDATVSAIQTDNANAMTALQTLLTLHQNNLVNLTNDEKDIVNQRITALQDQDKEVKSNADDVFKLMSDYPSAAVAGGVTLLDDRKTALAKMLPKMSAMETAKFNADLAKTASTGSDKDGSQADKNTLLAYKANGMPYADAVTRFAGVLSIDWINAAYGQAAPKAIDGADSVKNAYYQSYFNADGSLKSGVSIDSKGNPQIAAASSGGVGSWFGGIWKAITGGN